MIGRLLLANSTEVIPHCHNFLDDVATGKAINGHWITGFGSMISTVTYHGK